MPLGPASVPPPAPHFASALSPTTAPEFRPHPAPQPVPEPAPHAAPQPVPEVSPPPPPVLVQVHDSGGIESKALPTLVGVPPPPDLIPGSPDATIAPPMSPDVAPVSPLPTSTAAAAARVSGEAALPPPPLERSSARLHDFRSLAPSDPRAKIVIGAIGVVGVLVAVGMIGLVVRAIRGNPSDDTTAAAAATSTGASGAPSPTVPAATRPNPVPAVSPGAPKVAAIGGACTLAGAAHVVAPRAVVQSGVEVQTIGNHVALGFASGPRNGIAVVIDPSSLSAILTARVKAPDAIRRLTPIAGSRGLAAAADVDREGDALLGRRTVSAEPPLDLGLAGGGLAWAPHHTNEPTVIWTLDGDAPIEAPRVAPLDPANKDAGWAITFRRGASIYAGAVSGGVALVAKGPLVKMDGLGPQVGSPAIAAQDGAIVVAWADRPSADAPWGLRWMRFAPGDAGADAKPFVPSEGGLGEQAMSPALAAAGQGRFVLAWTEGPIASHQVRAQTISAAGTPIGAPIAVSEGGVNAGQAQLAVLPDGHGVVAYLASNESEPKAPYRVLATPIACP